MNFLGRYAKRARYRLAHPWEMRPQLRLLRDHDRIDVLNRKMFFSQQLLRMFQENQTIRALPLRIRVRKMSPDIPKPGRTEQRIAKRMRQHIAVRMSHRASDEGQLNPAHNQFSPSFQPMQIEPKAAANTNFFSF